MPGKCTTDKLVYWATVTTDSSLETYVGLTAGEFKDRYYKHEFDFQTPGQRISTKLSSYIWDLKDAGTSYKIKWDIVRRAYPYSAVSSRCDLCTAKNMKSSSTPNQQH